MDLLTALLDVADPTTIALILIGTVFGIFIGVLPGMGPTVACSVVLPFTLGMEPLDAITILVAIYCAGTYGGSISAILINTPGTPASVATALDGFPMAQKGEAARALGIATVSSAVAGIIAVIVFLIAAPVLARVAYAFGPSEYFALTVFGMSMLATVGGDPLKNIVAGLLGVLLATVGVDLMTGVDRFTFGIGEFSEGISFVPLMVGLFAISEFLVQTTALHRPVTRAAIGGVRLPSREDYARIWRTILRGTGIGTFIGILPAEGGTVAAIVAYNEERRWSDDAGSFGSGNIQGIAAAESANNAATAGAMVPTLALGIPGGSTTAVILAALIMHGLRPGPQLFVEQSGLFYGIAFSMLLANIAFFALGLLMAPRFAAVTRLPVAVLWPLVVIVSVVGTYAYAQSLLDVVIMFAAGIVGFCLRRYGFSSISLAIGLVLGELLETTLRQALILYDGAALHLFQSPLALVFFVLAALALSGPRLKTRIVRLFRRPGHVGDRS